MDSAPLVEQQIEDGRKLIEQLIRDGFDVTLAFWARFLYEEGGPWFYVVSKTVDQLGINAAYLAVHAAIHRIPAPWLFASEVGDLKLIRETDPIAKEVSAIRHRFPGRTWVRGAFSVGLRSIEELYIYSCPVAVVTNGDTENKSGA